MRALAKNEENYFTIDMVCIKALDIFKFFHPLSLDALTKTLSDDECETLNKFKLERRKCIIPNEWLDSLDELSNTEIPPKEAFHTTLRQSGFTVKIYQQALDCWNEGDCNTVKDYMMVSLKNVVLLSVNVFEKIRAMCLQCYERDLCYAFSTPSLTLLCELQYTNVKLKYYKEKQLKYDTIHKGIRGGLASVLGVCYVKCKSEK